jgi:hypothetical protein
MSLMNVNSSYLSAVSRISMLRTGRSTLIIAATLRTMRLFRTSGSVFAAGMPSKSLVYCNSPRVLRVFLSTDSRICRVVMDQEGLRSRRLASQTNCQSLTHVSTVSTYHLTRLMRRSTRNSPLLLRKLSASDKSRSTVFLAE